MNISLRTKAVISAFMTAMLIGALQFLDVSFLPGINQNIIRSLIAALFFAFSLEWVLNYNIRGIRLITLLTYSSFLVFIYSLFLELIVLQDSARISERTFSIFVLLSFFISIYLLILTVNILNVSYISKIPLARAAKAANFLYTLLGAYLSFLLVARSGIFSPLKVIGMTLSVFLFSLNIMWFKKESRKQLWGESIALTLAMFTMFVVFLLWPVSAELYSMFFIIVFYILLNLSLEERTSTGFLLKLEYVVLFLLAFILLLKITVWGINGSII